MTPQIEDYIMPVHMKLKNVWLIFLWSLFRGVYPGGLKKIVIFEIYPSPVGTEQS